MPIKLIDEEGEKIAATAFLAVFVWGLAAHAYGFLNLIISHDSIAEFFTSDAVMRWKVALGRFAEPIYLKVFHSGLALPWLNGVLTLIWLSVSVWLTARIFSIKDKIRIALIAGIFNVPEKYGNGLLFVKQSAIMHPAVRGVPLLRTLGFPAARRENKKI